MMLLGRLVRWFRDKCVVGMLADPVAGLVRVLIIAKEGVNGLRRKAACGGCGCTLINVMPESRTSNVG